MLSDPGASALILTALVVGITHTLMGPDHYLPFVALAKARGWSAMRTSMVTLLCGIGHVAGSILLGVLGLALGWSLGGLEAVESVRGDIAAWLLTVMGALYLAWAIKNFGRSRRHSHLHAHADGTVHTHEHHHHAQHAHPHEDMKRSTTAWSLFIIFVFGPCEAFIPLLLFPAVQHNLPLAAATTLVFAVATVGTMLVAVHLLCRGLEFLPLKQFSRYGHVAAGFAILACGTAIPLGP